MQIFKYLKPFILSIMLMITLFGVRAWAELQLPTYTSDIVNVGIQQNGIEDVVPTKISEKTLTETKLFMTEEERQLVTNSYEKEDGNYVLKNVNEEEKDKLKQIFSETLALVAFSSEKDDLQKVSQLISNTNVDNNQFVESRKRNVLGKEEEVKQVALAYLKKEYDDIGIDTNSIRNKYLKEVGLLMILVSFIATVASIITTYISSRVSSKVGRNLRNKLFEKVLYSSKQDIDKFSTASLITRSTNDIQQVQTTLNIALFMALFSPIMAIWGIYKVLTTNASMSWIIALGVIILAIIMGTLMYIVMPKFKIMQKLIDNINLVSREILTGLSVIRVFGREDYEREKFNKVNEDLRDNQLFTNRVIAFMFPSISLIMNGITIFIVWFGAKYIDKGTIQVGDMMAFLTYAIQIVMSFLMLTFLATMLPRATVAADRINEVLNTDITILDKENIKRETLENIKGDLVFDNVSFTFNGASEPVLKNISFSAKAGETTAIIGSTGSGKSTLIHLIPRYFDVTEGSIMIDGTDIRKIKLSELRDNLGFVPQKGVLFSGTIESNIKFGNENITSEELKNAAMISQATEFIESKEDKYNSEISQGGSNVSGGQKQRLSIARALAKNAKILLFDDSFSALDYKTDVKLRNALKESMQDTTTIIVAQRISTIMNADQIIVMNNGEIVGIGKHDDLLVTNKTYQEIAKSQLSEEELSKGGVSNEK